MFDNDDEEQREKSWFGVDNCCIVKHTMPAYALQQFHAGVRNRYGR